MEILQKATVVFFQNDFVGFCSSKTFRVERYPHTFPLEQKEKRLFKSDTKIRSLLSYFEIDIHIYVTN